MHKLAFFLIALLVILLPVGNSMNVSNANAIADFDKEDRKQVSVSSLNCNNINVNVNGLELDVFPPFLANSGITAEAAQGNDGPSSIATGNGPNSGSQINDFRFICINNNNNTVIEEQEQIPPTPPGPPEPTTSSLTVKKQVFGCDDILFLGPIISNDCQGLNNNSPEWLDCNNISSFSVPIFCQSLPESIFDIEVNASNTQQIQQFEGSEQGTTIPNLQPGTYIVNEIKRTPEIDQLAPDQFAESSCKSAGFTDGGILFNSTSETFSSICFEYEDEQGNDCSTITLAAGEERTCIVKNYIARSDDFP